MSFVNGAVGTGASSSAFGKVFGVALIALAFMGCTAAPEDTSNAGTGAPITGMAGVSGMNALAGTGAVGGAAGMSVPVGGAGAVGGAAGAMATGGTGGVAGTMATGGTGGVAGTAGVGGASGAAGAAGAAGEAGAAGAAGMVAPPARMGLCVDDPKQLALIGDSYVSWVSHTFPQDMAAEGNATGTWDRPPNAGTMYAVGGTSLTNMQIPNQLDSALAASPALRVIIMDGGGNDILLLGDPRCKATGSSMLQTCKDTVAATLVVSGDMMDQMADAGVSDVVYFFYPHTPLNTLLGGPNPNEILDYSMPMARDACEGTLERTGGKLACHFVDMIPVFEGHPEWFAPADLHPNSMGSKAMAAAIWDRMVAECVGQPSASGCCTP